MRDVARAAGVSQTTVSFVINDVPGVRIRASTRARVRAAVERLGYRPNAVAQGLRRATMDTIGFISDVVGRPPLAGEMLQGAQDAAWEKGKLLVLAATGDEPAAPDRAAATLVDRRVDGIVYATTQHRVVTPGEHLRAVPSVLLHAEAGDRSLSSVVPDEEEGAFTATSAVLRSGRRRIAMLVPRLATHAARARLAGYRRALEGRGVAFDGALVRRCESAPAEGYEATRELMDRDEAPDALVCVSDRMAIGVYQALSDLRMAIPRDVAVVGFDDVVPIARWLRPALSSVAVPHYDMGRWAVTHLLGLLDGPRAEGAAGVVQHRMRCPYVARASV